MRDVRDLCLHAVRLNLVNVAGGTVPEPLTSQGSDESIESS